MCYNEEIDVPHIYLLVETREGMKIFLQPKNFLLMRYNGNKRSFSLSLDLKTDERTEGIVYRKEGCGMNNYLTEEAIKKLNEEIEYRKVVLRYKILEDVKEARAQGDLSENFEYKAAKKERSKNESRIRYLERMIRTANVIKDTTADDEVGIGKKISVRFIKDDEVEEFTIVTTVEVDPFNNLISIESPMGKAIYKHKVGDEIKISSVEGEYTVRIEKITQ